MIDGVNSASSIPTWLQVVGVVGPITAALIAGMFVLHNGRKRPTDLLAQLVSIKKDLPDGVDPNCVVEREMLRQLIKVESRESREYRTLMTYIGLLGPILPFVLAYLIWSVARGYLPGVIACAVIGAAAVVLIVALWNRYQLLATARLYKRYKPRFEMFAEPLATSGPGSADPVQETAGPNDVRSPPHQ